MNGEPTEQMDNPNSDSVQGLVQYISYPLYKCKGWMKLLGVLSIIAGIIYAKLKTYFIILGILTILSMILSVIFFMFGFMGAFMSHSGFRL